MPFDFRGSVDEDYMADPDLPWSWRLRAEEAGLGTLGDLTVHLVSLARRAHGPDREPDGDRRRRCMPSGRCRAAARARVENEDIAHALVRFAGGARGVLASSRVAHGRKNGLRVEVHGSEGMLWLDNERMNELNLYVAEGPAAEARVPPILSGPAHRRLCAALPGAGARARVQRAQGDRAGGAAEGGQAGAVAGWWTSPRG